MKVLLVEDEPRMADAIRRVLTAEHYTVDLAGDGMDALAFLAGAPYDVVVLDRLLPDMTGIEVTRHARARGITTPILMLTALSALEHRVEGLDAGADDYLPKPFAFSELLARLRALHPPLARPDRRAPIGRRHRARPSAPRGTRQRPRASSSPHASTRCLGTSSAMPARSLPVSRSSTRYGAPSPTSIRMSSTSMSTTCAASWPIWASDARCRPCAASATRSAVDRVQEPRQL